MSKRTVTDKIKKCAKEDVYSKISTIWKIATKLCVDSNGEESII